MFSRSAYGLRTARSVCFAVVAGLTLAAFHTPLTVLVRFSFAREHYSHILLVPLASAFLLILERKRIFSDVATGWRAGLPLVVAGPLVYAFARRPSLSAGDTDQLSILAALVPGRAIIHLTPPGLALGGTAPPIEHTERSRGQGILRQQH